METLELEEVDQEMIANEAVQSFATETSAPENAPTGDALLETMLLLTPETDT